ncbi:serine-type endopeptidase inhibitor [Panicum miliaceum]|uniref:Serine-type endopeptidase inhibitor n=1 Tax=Panicum miliaceum TaxID=4540 RepID=A0A3L6SLV2_PANMI|nr:serine-type endopeptidase inhibitor [Panicum miliaceum]
MPPSRFVHLILLVTLSLLLAQTLASSSPAAAASAASASAGPGAEAETGDPCAAAAADGDGDVQLCPVRCFRPDPVCGADGVTYWCGCPEAACAGARVARRGYCEVGAGSAPVSGQALLLVHIVWLFVLGAAVLLGFL